MAFRRRTCCEAAVQAPAPAGDVQDIFTTRPKGVGTATQTATSAVDESSRLGEYSELVRAELRQGSAREQGTPTPKCPACETQIRHDGSEPAPGRVYRCHVCRLELVVDKTSGRMVVVPLPAFGTLGGSDK